MKARRASKPVRWMAPGAWRRCSWHSCPPSEDISPETQCKAYQFGLKGKGEETEGYKTEETSCRKETTAHIHPLRTESWQSILGRGSADIIVGSGVRESGPSGSSMM